MKKLILAALAAATLAAGCATTGPQTSTETFNRDFVTGSNIGRKKGEAPTDQVKIYSKEAIENQYRTGNIGNGATPGPGGS